MLRLPRLLHRLGRNRNRNRNWSQSHPFACLSTDKTTHTHICPICGFTNIHLALFCSSCGCAQKLDRRRTNFFELFEIPERFDVDVEIIHDNFKRLQKQLHPDKFATKSSAELIIANENSSFVNNVKDVLSQPLFRAKYMQRGIIVLEEESNTVVDPKLMKEMFELREHLEDLKTKEEFDAAEVDLKVKLGAIEQCLSGCFETQNLPEAASQVVKLQYMTKAWDELVKLKS